MAIVHGGGHHVHGATSGLSVEKLLERAHATGVLSLCSRNLKTFPKHRCKYDLKDTVNADLSRNKLTELPQECTDYHALEQLVLYNNTIRSIPDSIAFLQSLQFLDISRNQLSYLPASICELPLQGLVVNNNRLVSLPEEVGKMQTLMELDASCNEITHLPVQIGDLCALKLLNLRRNHLQEIPIEMSYLLLTRLDLSGNRISTLPVELRFMTTLVSLELGENPLSCPPANLCSRGKVHVFKHLEIQAVKEDRKRGVLTDVEYRKTYRKTSQLNDFRFANGFGADARRKRHTADSGYGSEQPLDRRWSQEFSQETQDSSVEGARRIIMRAAANGPRSPRGGGLLIGPIDQRHARFSHANQPPLTSTGSTGSSASSGYGSMNREVPQSAPDLTRLRPSSSTNLHETRLDHFSVKEKVPSQNGYVGDDVRSGGESPDDQEKEERRKAAEKVFGRQGNGAYGKPRVLSANRLQLSSTKQQSQQQSMLDTPMLPPKASPNGSMLPMPLTSPQQKNQPPPNQYRQFKELQRQRHIVVANSQQGGDPTNIPQQLRSPNGSNEGLQMHAIPNQSDPAASDDLHLHEKLSQPRLTSAALARMQLQQSNTSVEIPITRNPFDMKAMQKEAVLSYVKSKQLSPSRSTQSEHGIPRCNNNGRSSSTTAIPLPSSLGIHRSKLGRMKMHSSSMDTNGRQQFTGRQELEKSSTADAHISQLRMEIESRMHITLPEDLSIALADGVILCHIANHVKPRVVPSIHVPSPAVPKLSIAKCRRNVENFLLACRKVGVREDLICSPSDILEPRKQGSVRVAISVSELLRFHQPKS